MRRPVTPLTVAEGWFDGSRSIAVNDTASATSETIICKIAERQGNANSPVAAANVLIALVDTFSANRRSCEWLWEGYY